VCHKNNHCNSNFEDTKLASDAVTALPPESVNLLVWKPHIFSAYIETNNRRYKNQDTPVGRSGCEWKTADTLTPQLAKEQLARDSCAVEGYML
jgi:hypothetical protein